MNLNELAVERDAFDALMDENGGELTDELAAQFDFLNLAEADKLDRYVFVIRSLEGDAAAFDGKRAYYQQLALAEAQKRDTLLKRVEWLRRRVRTYMEGRGVKELRGEHFGFRLQKNGGKPPIEILAPVDELPRHWLRISIEPDKDAIRRDLERETAVPPGLARIGESGLSLRIT